MTTGFTKKRELMIIIGEKVILKSPRVCIYYPARLKWSYFNHNHISSDYIVTFAEVNKRYLVTLAVSEGKGAICSYF